MKVLKKGKGKLYTFVGRSSCAALEIIDKEPREDGFGMSSDRRVSELDDDEIAGIRDVNDAMIGVCFT